MHRLSLAITHVLLAVMVTFLGLTACDDDATNATTDANDAVLDDTQQADADAGDTADSGDADTTLLEDSTDSGDDDGDIDSEDTTPPPLPELGTHDPATPPPDRLVGTGLTSCATYQAESCDVGTLHRCSVYDTVGGQFVADPDPLLHRTLLFDRWYDLYHDAAGQVAERVFISATPPGTPEASWGDLSHFAGYVGRGDAAIWNGAALMAFTMRYLETGTDADYSRMEQKVRDMLLQFDVTGIPGYLARYHYLQVDATAPREDRYHLNYGSEPSDHLHRDVADPSLPGLPDIYTQGLPDPGGGAPWMGTARYKGNPSIDQYSGPLTAFPFAYGLLRDDALKARMVEHITCYLKRLDRIEIHNLQQNPAILDSLQQYFVQGEAKFDPDDIDYSGLDRIVLYVLRQPNEENEATYSVACPAEIQMTPSQTLDASSASFLLDLVALVSDFDARTRPRANAIDHFYVPSVRGGDAIHLMHLAALAYHWTGDDAYRRFLFEELIGNIGTLGVAHTAGAFNLPEYCRAFFGHHIGFQPTWSFMAMLDDDDPLKAEIQRVFEVEMWQKEMRTHDNAKFNIMYAGEVPDGIATAKDAALQTALGKLDELGGNGGVLDDPRRAYHVDRGGLILKMLAEGNDVRCPSEAERATCEDGFEVMGIPVPGASITRACSGAPGECPMDNGTCATGLARDALPMGDRRYEDFAWQRNPFEIGANYGVEGTRQSPGLDLTEAYWMARWYGFVAQGEGMVLAWEPVGACP